MIPTPEIENMINFLERSDKSSIPPPDMDFDVRDFITCIKDLLADRQRMDWLEKNKTRIDYFRDKETYDPGWQIKVGNLVYFANTLIAAIDAAMKETE